MNLLDLMILVGLAAAIAGGWRLGFMARFFGWVGIFLALAIGAHFVPGVVTEFGGSTPGTRALAALLFLVLVASIGQAGGLAVGLLLDRLRATKHQLPRADRVAGAAVGALGVLVVVWMAAPSLATARGWSAGAARDSFIVGAVDAIGPDRPPSIEAWARWIAEAPAVLDPLTTPPDPGVPPVETLDPDVDASVRPSTVKVSSEACGKLQEGSGFVAELGIVVTNAHVVAGSTSTFVETNDGERHSGEIVGFDPARDLAIVAVADLRSQALPLGEATVGSDAAVYGHPGGGPLRPAPARIGERIVAIGTDIYHRSEVRRDVLVLAARLANGDSGAALVDDSAQVVGIAFAIDPQDASTAYALASSEVAMLLDTVTPAAVPTGPCVAG